MEEKIFDFLTEKFQLKFHVLSIQEEKFKQLQKICPLTKSMLYYFVSNKRFQSEQERIIDKNHIEFLLMMPEDMLKIQANSKVFYDNIRRLLAIQKFLENKTIDSVKINQEVKDLISKVLYLKIKNNNSISEEELKKLRGIISKKLSAIGKKL